jgi:hypothetical protein
VGFVGSEPWVHAFAEVETVEEMFMVAHSIQNIAPLSRVAFVLQEDVFHPLKREAKRRKNSRCAGEKENT